MALPLALFSFRSLVAGPALMLPFISLAFLLACNAEPTAAPGANAATHRRGSSNGSPADCRHSSDTAHCNDACYGRARNSDLRPCSHLHSSTSAQSCPDALTPRRRRPLLLFRFQRRQLSLHWRRRSPPGSTANPRPHSDCCPAPGSAATPTVTSVTPMPTPETSSTLWRGLTVAPKDRCSPYDPDDYSYSPSVEPRIVDAQDGIYGPYTGTWFESIRETDIEHIVARSEAHDSGLCAADSDPVNLTLASPSVNRLRKSDKDPSGGCRNSSRVGKWTGS